MLSRVWDIIGAYAMGFTFVWTSGSAVCGVEAPDWWVAISGTVMMFWFLSIVIRMIVNLKPSGWLDW